MWCDYWGSFFGGMAGALVGVGLAGVVINFLQWRFK